MTKQRFDPRTTILIAFTIIIALLRILTPYAEHSGSILTLTPMGALALLGGAYFKGNVKPFFIPLAALFVSDVILCATIYSKFSNGILYPGWVWVYLSFVLMIVVGKFLIKRRKLVNLLPAVITATLIHWLVANLSGCLDSTSSPEFLTAYSMKLVSGINYELRFLLGTAIYGILMFGVIELIQKRSGKIVPNNSEYHKDQSIIKC